VVGDFTGFFRRINSVFFKRRLDYRKLQNLTGRLSNLRKIAWYDKGNWEDIIFALQNFFYRPLQNSIFYFLYILIFFNFNLTNF
jgi:hypothetical protein